MTPAHPLLAPHRNYRWLRRIAQQFGGQTRHASRCALIAAASLVLALQIASAAAHASPIATGQPKFIGSAYSPAQTADFEKYWNKVTPENAGKWGEIEAVRDVMEWATLDAAYQFARQHRFPFHMHVMVWGNQQPEWIRHLPPAEQREEIEEWFAAVAERYPDIDIVEVVNEPLHDPPCSDDADGGNYCEALGGAGETGWDWIIESFRLARRYFPDAQLLLNDFSITNVPADAQRYRAIVDLLQQRGLVDAVGVQAHAFETSCETGAEVHRASLDLLAGAGLPLYVTELDIDGHTDADQLDHYQRVFPLFWEHPAVAGITLWGWRPGLWRDAQGANLVDSAGQPRPALRWLRDYVAGKTTAAAPPCPAPASILDRPITGALALIENGRPLALQVDAADFAGVQRAAESVRADLVALAGSAPAADAPAVIIAGTLGHSPRIDRLVAAKKLDVSDVAGRWEAYSMQVVYRPEEGVEHALVIVGADKRGTIFGLYELARRLGVSPWTFWADVPITPRANAWITPGRFVDAPAVRYRGIFLNDEEPALGGWMRATYGGPNSKFYERVFELILRLKGNYLWPAMWGSAFYDDDPQNAVLADSMGVVIATSHHEPMQRAHVEWARYGKGPWDYTRNAETLRQFWREGIERARGRESVITLGMRGDGDEAMSEHTAIDLLQRIVADQREIIAEVSGQAPEATPQVWALYKEVQDYFDAGMQVPDDVTLLFADDNWGNIRRLPQPGAQRAGGYGVYYHFDYVGGPRNYKWLNTTQIERTWEQMQLAWAHGVDRIWVVNVGDLKPMELPISLFLDLAWNPDALPLQRLKNYPQAWATEQFGPQHAAEIGDLLSRYTRYNARRKPELLTPDTYSLLHEREAERVLAEWDTLAADTLRIGAELPASHRDAWVQLVEYPVLASANLNALYIATARNRLYASQGRASANAQAAEARRLFARDAELQRVYEHDIAGGKWVHMMSQARIGYTHWQQPERNVLPALAEVDVRAGAAMGVAIEGDARTWPRPAEYANLPPLDPIGAPARQLSVFNHGATSFRVSASTDHAWLSVQPSEAEVSDELRLQVSIDPQQAPPGTHTGRLVLRGSEGTELHVSVPVSTPDPQASIKGHVESAGVVAIEAQHHARASAPEGLSWVTLPNLGRTLSGVTSWPQNAPAQPLTADSPHLEYPIHLNAGGEFNLHVRVSPTLDTRGGEGLRFAVSIDDELPQIQTIRLDPTPGHRDFPAWERAVSDSVHVARSQHRIERGGAHTLKLWRIDPGVVFQRIELWRDEPRESYLGPVESSRR
jgi:GH35 family endo-1,4-beta-xylanase